MKTAEEFINEYHDLLRERSNLVREQSYFYHYGGRLFKRVIFKLFRTEFILKTGHGELELTLDDLIAISNARGERILEINDKLEELNKHLEEV